MKAEEFLKLWHEWEHETPDGFTEVSEDEDVDHKTVYVTVIYLSDTTGQYFRIVWTKDNVGHWGDPEFYWDQATCAEVFPVTKTIVTYKARAKGA